MKNISVLVSKGETGREKWQPVHAGLGLQGKTSYVSQGPWCPVEAGPVSRAVGLREGGR